ncbi:hypothetical protein [Luteolibacter marinus]|uniref:hypothetical protein n=1 Tax=Luteolibacter marinus TaxID=2776705 RepID=UPI00186940B1|nr:hypothetical protein [Luteolibacter marinus]
MKNLPVPTRSALGRALAMVAFVAIGSTARAQWVDQTITLNPGWNAVFLEVQPQPADADLVFGNLPVESVWEWNRRSSSVQFIQDPNQLIPRSPEWATWFPESSPNRFLANLFDVQGGRAYLIKVGGASSVNWTLRGTPARPDGVWIPDSFNLTGFFVGTAGAPTFSNYFASSPAHAGQQVFRMDAAGKWVLTAQTSTIQRGQAYWVRTIGGSDFAGPVVVELERSAGIDFGQSLEEAEVVVRNRSDSQARTVSLALENSLNPPPDADTSPAPTGPALLFYRDPATADSDNPFGQWTPFDGTINASLAPGEFRRFMLATRRAEMPGSAPGGSASYQSILAVTETGGTSQKIAVRVGSGSVAPQPAAIVGGQAPQSIQAPDNAGLWVGSATLNEVSWAVANRKLIAAAQNDDRLQLYKNPANIDFEDPETFEPISPPDGLDPDATLPTPSEFVFRVIIHVDSAGQARLLQKVLQVWEDGSDRPDPNNPGYFLPETPGRFRLFSSEQGATDFRGASLRRGDEVPKRLSTAAYPLAAPQPLSGTFGEGPLTGTVTLSHTSPFNPFVHQYHPQHDNLDARYQSTLPPGEDGSESYVVIRNISLEFADQHPEGRITPGWGTSEIGGRYKETITGIHRTPLRVAGDFILRRVSTNSQLD